MNSPHKWPVTRKIFPFDDVIMMNSYSAKLLSLPVEALSDIFVCQNTGYHISCSFKLVNFPLNNSKLTVNKTFYICMKEMTE